MPIIDGVAVDQLRIGANLVAVFVAHVDSANAFGTAKGDVP